jgi:hypothetical protein
MRLSTLLDKAISANLPVCFLLDSDTCDHFDASKLMRRAFATTRDLQCEHARLAQAYSNPRAYADLRRANIIELRLLRKPLNLRRYFTPQQFVAARAHRAQTIEQLRQQLATMRRHYYSRGA